MSNYPISKGNRIWIYQTNRPINELEQEKINPELDAFIAEWATHGTQLSGGYQWINPYILILGVDEKAVMPSGCSIDSSGRFLRELGAKYTIDFFVRMKSVILHNEEWKQVDFNAVGELNDIKVVDTTITDWNDFLEKGIVAPAESGLVSLFN